MKKSLFAVAVSFALAAPAYAAGPQPGKFSMSVFGGTDTPVSGDVHDGATAAVPDLGPLNPALAGVSAELRIQPRCRPLRSIGLEPGIHRAQLRQHAGHRRPAPRARR